MWGLNGCSRFGPLVCRIPASLPLSDRARPLCRCGGRAIVALPRSWGWFLSVANLSGAAGPCPDSSILFCPPAASWYAAAAAFGFPARGSYRANFGRPTHQLAALFASAGLALVSVSRVPS